MNILNTFLGKIWNFWLQYIQYIFDSGFTIELTTTK